MEILWTFLWRHHKIGLYLGVVSMHFKVFFKVKVQKGTFFGWLKFQIFLGVLEIPDTFLWWAVDAWPEPTYEEKLEYTPPPPGHSLHPITVYRDGGSGIKLNDGGWRIYSYLDVIGCSGWALSVIRRCMVLSVVVDLLLLKCLWGSHLCLVIVLLFRTMCPPFFAII